MKNLISRAQGYYFQLAIFLFFLTIYSLTMFPGAGGRINWGDSIKWQYLHLANGLPHSTGYPQFLLLSEIFSRVLFFLDMPERITFIAVFFGALAMAVFYSLVHLLTKNKTGSVLATLFMGFTYTFWAQSTEAEVYTLNIFYLLSVFYLFIQFYYTKSNKYFLAGCAVYALSFGNHLTMVTILPAILFISLWSDYRKVFAPRNLVAIAVFVLIGMSQYLLIYYRAHTSDPLYMESPYKPDFSQFIGYVTGRGFHDQMLSFTLPQILYARINVLFQFLNLNFTIVGLLLSSAGFFYFLYQKKGYVELIFISLALLGQLAFNISYDVGDLIVFFIPVYIILGLFAGLIFAARNTLIPSVLMGALTICTFWISTRKMDILTENTFVQQNIRPFTSMYEEQNSSHPLYLWPSDYYINMYMKYDKLTSENSPFFSLAYTDILPDTFYIAKESEITPALQDQHEISVAYTEDASQFLYRKIKPSQAVFISVMDEGAAKLPAEFYNILQQHGSKIDSIPFRGSYAAVLYNGKMVEELNGNGPADIRSTTITNNPLTDQLTYHVHSSGFDFGNNSIIRLNGFDYATKRRGVNFVVYDTVKEEVTDIINFDTHLGEEKKLLKATRKPKE
ncbi:protein O-mannosyl-transferase family [Pontibacter beigongshangensis]|uniref:protein O-mannosyl-transferase family n=1 Tax=Pontibacter beigongshangensis TaxID=2574733 RepID=UPI00164F0DE7|nr:DUF2723 domain-containing protein [Pontibacter beigongshangensis]